MQIRQSINYDSQARQGAVFLEVLAVDLVFLVVALPLGAVFDLLVLVIDFLSATCLRVGDFVGVVFHSPSFCAWAIFCKSSK